MSANSKLTSAEAAKLMNCSISTLKNLVRDNFLKPELSEDGSSYRFSREQIYASLGVPTPKNEPFIGREEACKILGLRDPQYVITYCRRNAIPYYSHKKGLKGATNLFLKSDLIAFKKANLAIGTQVAEVISFQHAAINIRARIQFSKFIERHAGSMDLAPQELACILGLYSNAPMPQIDSNSIGMAIGRAMAKVDRWIFRVQELGNLEKLYSEVLTKNSDLNKEVDFWRTKCETLAAGKLSNVLPSGKLVFDFNDASARLKGLLRARGITNVFELASLDIGDFLKQSGCGIKSVIEAEIFLRRGGLCWRSGVFYDDLVARTGKTQKPQITNNH